MKKVEKSIELGGRTLTLTTGELAEQAAGSVMARMGDTVVLANVSVAPLKMEMDYFPLMVEFQERLSAGGRIKGSRWVKREGRPTDEEVLSARLIDRSIRPLFPKTYKKEVQLIVMVLSVDGVNDSKILGAIAASAAIHTSTLPWKGPIAPLTVGIKDGKYIVNPESADLEEEPSIELVRDVKKLVGDKMANLVKNMANHEGPSDEYAEFIAAIKDNFEKDSDKKFVLGI